MEAIRTRRNSEFRIELFDQRRDAAEVTFAPVGDEESIEVAELCFEDVGQFLAVVGKRRVDERHGTLRSVLEDKDPDVIELDSVDTVGDLVD